MFLLFHFSFVSFSHFFSIFFSAASPNYRTPDLYLADVCVYTMRRDLILARARHLVPHLPQTHSPLSSQPCSLTSNPTSPHSSLVLVDNLNNNLETGSATGSKDNISNCNNINNYVTNSNSAIITKDNINTHTHFRKLSSSSISSTHDALHNGFSLPNNNRSTNGLPSENISYQKQISGSPSDKISHTSNVNINNSAVYSKSSSGKSSPDNYNTDLNSNTNSGTIITNLNNVNSIINHQLTQTSINNDKEIQDSSSEKLLEEQRSKG